MSPADLDPDSDNSDEKILYAFEPMKCDMVINPRTIDHVDSNAIVVTLDPPYQPPSVHREKSQSSNNEGFDGGVLSSKEMSPEMTKRLL